MCHACHCLVPDQKAQRCTQGACRAKRLAVDKPTPEPKVLIGKEAMKIITAADSAETDEDDKKVKAEIERLKTMQDDAKKNGWNHIVEFTEKRLMELKPKVISPELDTAKDTRIVMSDRVRLLHAHEAR